MDRVNKSNEYQPDRRKNQRCDKCWETAGIQATKRDCCRIDLYVQSLLRQHGVEIEIKRGEFDGRKQ